MSKDRHYLQLQVQQTYHIKFLVSAPLPLGIKKYTYVYLFYRRERQETLFFQVIIVSPTGEDFWEFQIWIIVILRPTEDGLSRSTGKACVNDGN